MLLSQRSLLLLVASCAFVVGCAQKPNTGEVPPDAFAKSDRVVSLAQNPGVEHSPLDAPPAVTLVFQVDIYQLSLPFGTYGTNEDFWKHIDEQCVDVATHELLSKNGIRVGVAARSELRQFEKYMVGIVPTQRFTVRGNEVKNVEIEAKKELVEQTIFVFDTKSQTPPGRTYDRSDNIINLSFEPAPRKQGELRLLLCPMVRAHRKHLEYSVTNQEREYEYVSPEHIYELNLRTDVPLDGFMVVAPSEDAKRKTSVGRAFLTKDMPTQQMEQVLLIIPKAYRVPDDQVKSVLGR